MEVIDGEEHQHSAVSKINLVDLAGSERQVLAKTSGDRLRVCSSCCFDAVETDLVKFAIVVTTLHSYIYYYLLHYCYDIF